MRIETLCTGDELLTGLTADTNSTFFQTRLLERLGLTVRRSTVVGDVREDIVEALRTIAGRADAVLVSGGLGPTTDDLTAECAAAAAGVGLVLSHEAMRHLEARFRARNVALSENNRRQALVPAGAEVVLNAEGSAPMFVLRLGGCAAFFVPGVPREYRHLVESAVLPRLEALVATTAAAPPVRVLRVLKTVGLPESHLDARVRPLMEKHPHVVFGFRTHPPENHLKLLAGGLNRELAQARLAAAEQDARALLGRHVFAQDDETMATVVGALLRARKETVAVAESCTGGLVSALLTDPAGASDYFVGGAVSYRESTKALWAHVPADVLERHGAVSEPVARTMATGVRFATRASWGLAVTGFAGPTGGDAATPVGTVFVAVSHAGDERAERHAFHGDRERVRAFAAHAALDLLRRTMQESTS